MSEVSPGKLTRQELYDKIRDSSKEEIILSEMKRLGFWSDDNIKPSPAEESINRQVELQSELKALLKRQRQIEDPERALKEMRKKRLKASREKQEQNRIVKNQERYDRALAWHEKQKTDITFVGEGVSQGLSDHHSDDEKLAAKGLPLLHTNEQLAKSMGIAIGELRFLSYSRDVSTVSHYKHFSIRKKTGGERRICAPMPRLKHAQYWVLENILNKLPQHNAAHGFVKGRSIVTNASPHVGQALVINMDLKEFFPTLTYKRVKGLIKSFGYSEQIATVIGLILTEPQCDEVELHGQQFYVARGERRLPQGSPASPAISNLTCRSLDHRLMGMAKSLGFVYTRYADDMTFSAADASSIKELNKLLWRSRAIVQDEGFVIHPEKTRIMRKGTRQEVTGIVVNEKPSIDRAKVRRLRAAIHCLENKGWDAVTWDGSDNVPETVVGFANYLCMVDPERGDKYRDRLNNVAGKVSRKHAVPGQYANRTLRENARGGIAPNWWKPSERSAPVLEKTQQQLQDEKRAVMREKKADSKSSQSQQGRSQSNSANTYNADAQPNPNGRDVRDNQAAPLTQSTIAKVWPVISKWLTVFALVMVGLYIAIRLIFGF